MKNVNIFPIYYRRGPKPGEDKSECINRFYLSPYIKQSYLYTVIKDILRFKFNENQTNLIYNKIIKRVCKV